MTRPSLEAWTEPGRSLVAQAAAWHAWAPRWLPSRLATLVRRQKLRRYEEPVLCNLTGGRQFVAYPSDLLQCIVAANGSWEGELLQAVRPLVRPGAIVLDIGAHVGYSAVMFADWVGDSGRVHCFEPMPDHQKQLLRNLTVNGLERRVNIVSAAVTDGVGECPFFDSRLSNSGMSSLIGPEGRSSRTVKTVSIDAWIANENAAEIAFVKVDVEGAEAMVVRGMIATLQRRRVAAVLIELHPHVVASTGADVRRLFRQVGGYELFDWGHDDRFHGDPREGAGDYVLAVRSDRAGVIEVS